MYIDKDSVVVWPSRFKPLPDGYRVRWTGSHYVWETDNDEGAISWDAYWVRRCVFADARRKATEET